MITRHARFAPAALLGCLSGLCSENKPADQNLDVSSYQPGTLNLDGEIVAGAMVHTAGTKILEPGIFGFREHLLMTPGDLTDTAGRAHFLLSPGSYHFAARDGHGHVGWTEVEIGAAASDVKVVLRPLREVVATLPKPDPNADPNPKPEDIPVPRGAQLALQLMGVHKRPK